MIVAGVDPGTEKSAIVVWTGERIMEAISGLKTNTELVDYFYGARIPDVLVIEKVESFGMAVGAEVFETVFWSGRFAEAWTKYNGGPLVRLPRREVKQHICHTARATDANIRQALIDRFGGQEKAIGKKAAQGPLYPLKGHLWAAFAVAITHHDRHAARPEEIRTGVTPEF